MYEADDGVSALHQIELGARTDNGQNYAFLTDQLSNKEKSFINLRFTTILLAENRLLIHPFSLAVRTNQAGMRTIHGGVVGQCTHCSSSKSIALQLATSCGYFRRTPTLNENWLIEFAFMAATSANSFGG